MNLITDRFSHQRPTRRTVIRTGSVALLALTLGPVFAADPLPTFWLIGDSTVKNGTKGQVGWGDPFAAYFDPTKITIVNRARGGRSSRTFLTEGLWDTLLKEAKAGDYVLMQFGHNDGGPMDEGRARASIHSNSDETKEVTIKETGKKEIVLTYGAYLRRYIRDAKAKGLHPLVVSPVPRNIWSTEGKVNRASGDYGKWAAEAAQQEGVPFIDLNEIIAREYEKMGKEKVAPLFTDADHTHTSPEGAEVNARCVVAGIKRLTDSALAATLAGKASDISPTESALIKESHP